MAKMMAKIFLIVVINNYFIIAKFLRDELYKCGFNWSVMIK